MGCTRGVNLKDKTRANSRSLGVLCMLMCDDWERIGDGVLAKGMFKIRGKLCSACVSEDYGLSLSESLF